jgi:hypothetical protein
MEPAPINPALKRRTQKALQTNVNDPNLLLALRNLSTFYTRNSQASRWNLRDQLENKTLEVNEEVVQAFQDLGAELDDLKVEIEMMASTCDRMQARINQVKEASGLAIKKAEQLFHDEEATQVQLAVTQRFLAHFTLSSAQLRAIKNNEVSAEFFEALKRVHEIFNHSRTLLVGETQLQQRTGAEIASTMSELLEVAYRKLYRWVRSETKFLEIYHDPEVPALMVQAFEALQERPILLSYCLEEIAQTRSLAVSDGFLDALTIGGPNGVPRPIDIQAHDPKRYVGDMAAFIHQVLASELELLNGGILRKVKKSAFVLIQSANAPLKSDSSDPSLLASSSHINLASSLDSQISSQDNGITSTQGPEIAVLSPGHPQLHPANKMTHEERCYRGTMAKLLNIELSGLCKPFQARVEKVFETHPNPVLLYHLANLFYYYSQILAVHLDSTSAISKTFLECRDSAYKAFFRALGARLSYLVQQRPLMPSADLSPTHDFTEVVFMLQDVMRILDTSIIPTEDKEYEALPILDRIVDPLLQACIAGIKSANATLKPGPRGMPVQGGATNIDLNAYSLEQAVYLVNCTTSICKVLEKFPFCITKLANLKSIIDAQVTALVSEQSASALRSCGVAPKVALIEQFEASQATAALNEPRVLALMPGMDATSLRNTIRSFEANILELGTLSMPQIDKIEDDRVRSQARKATSSALADTYSTIFDAISSADSGYPNPDSILRYKPDQVRMMMNV